jgi:hypothetical protein
MIRNKYIKFTSILLFFSLLVTGIQIGSTNRVNFVIMQTPTIDGVINSGEYNSMKSFGGGNYELSWELIDDTSISIGIIAQTTGWIAIGFDPTTQMLDADIIFGWVETNGSVVIFDAFSLQATGNNHPADTDQGGTDDIISFDGSENATHTTIEFSRLLATGDATDNDIPLNGEIDIIWAYGSSDSFSEYHGGARGSSTMSVGSSQQTTTTTALDTTTTQDQETTTTTGSAPGFQGFLLIFSLLSLVFIFRKRH